MDAILFLFEICFVLAVLLCFISLFHKGDSFRTDWERFAVFCLLMVHVIILSYNDFKVCAVHGGMDESFSLLLENECATTSDDVAIPLFKV